MWDRHRGAPDHGGDFDEQHSDSVQTSGIGSRHPSGHDSSPVRPASGSGGSGGGSGGGCVLFFFLVGLAITLWGTHGHLVA